MSTTDSRPDYIIKAMARTWSLGQTYWQQAYSESRAANRRSADTHATYIALLDEVRAALAQPAASGEPAIHWPQVVAYPGGNGGLGAWVDISTGDGPECVVRYVPAASGEPVAWRWPAPKLKGVEWRYTARKTHPNAQPLYAAPQPAPARAPLMDAEVDDLARTMVKGNKSVNWLCRAIEAAHGITAESQSGRDWSLLEATQESLREHMAEIAGLRAALAAERERCAVLVEDTQKQWPGEGLDGWLLAAEIRGPNVELTGPKGPT